MTDRTPEQINHNIDQTLAICAETSRNLTKLELLVQDFIASAKPRLLSLETSREQDEERLEELENNRLRMERAHLEHQERMNNMAAATEQLRADHQARIDRQDRIIELWGDGQRRRPCIGRQNSCLLTYRSLLLLIPVLERLTVRKRENLPGLEDDHATAVTRWLLTYRIASNPLSSSL